MKCILLFLFFFTCSVFGAEKIELVLEPHEVRQGALVKGTLKIPSEFVNIPVQKLKGTTFADTLYFYRVSPLLRTETSADYRSEVQVIFVKIPESSSATGKIADADVLLVWSPVKVSPVETPEKMLWADFTAPDIVLHHWQWLLLIPLLAGLFYAFYRAYLRVKKRDELRNRRRKLSEEIRGCRDYESVVGFWKKKHTYLRDFPLLEEPFKKFEAVLFKYQFKSFQTEEEKETVMRAYRTLLQECEGGLRGI